MLATEEKRKVHERHFSVEEQVRALAVVLRDEFGVPFQFYNAKTGAAIKSDEDAAATASAPSP